MQEIMQIFDRPFITTKTLSERAFKTVTAVDHYILTSLKFGIDLALVHTPVF